MDQPRILIIDDEPAMLVNCERILAREGLDCSTLADPSRFRDALQEVKPDVVLLDLLMPGVNGMTLLTVSLAEDPALPIIIMTAHASVASAVRAITEGAFDYLEKPFNSGQLVLAVTRAVRHRALALENRALREQVESRSDRRILGSSQTMAHLLRRAEKVAASDSNVLITGESGTGKELISRYIHSHSRRSQQRFTPVDCAALPEGLLESELFGYERGAFTGAMERKIGLLEQGDGGTVFFDEVTELSMGLQSKLLRVLEERKVRRLGGSDLIDIDVRVVAATNIDLDEAIQNHTFREDLYFRLNVIPLQLPPLRDRDGDVLILAQAYFAEFSAAQQVPAPRVSPEVWDALESYHWPGNVRELRNVVERMAVLHEGDRITLADVPRQLRPGGDALEHDSEEYPLPYTAARRRALTAFRERYARDVLDWADGNVSKAARAAHVTRRSVYRWLEEGNESRPGLEGP